MDTLDQNLGNLQSVDIDLYNIIVNYGLSHTHIAKHMYPNEWKDDPDTRKKLSSRFRNKLNGNGSLTDVEYSDIIEYISEFQKTTKKAIKASYSKNKKVKKKKAEDFINSLSDDDKEILKSLIK